MEATNPNVCPNCGSGDLEVVFTRMTADGLQLNQHSAAFCHRCKTIGPLRIAESDAMHAFCHPAHLMANLHTYDPVTEMIITKDEAELFLFACEQLGRMWVYARTNRGILTSKATDRLRAALGVK